MFESECRVVVTMLVSKWMFLSTMFGVRVVGSVDHVGISVQSCLNHVWCLDKGLCLCIHVIISESI